MELEGNALEVSILLPLKDVVVVFLVVTFKEENLVDFYLLQSNS